MHTKDHPFVGIIVVTLVVVIGLLTYAYTEHRESVTESENLSQPEQEQQEDITPLNPSPINDVSFRTTIIGTSGDDTINAVLAYDGQGSIQIEFLEGEDNNTYIITPTFTYICVDDGCVREASDATTLPQLEPREFVYSEADYSIFRNNSPLYLGQRPCPAGTCHTWDVSREEGESMLLFIDTDTTTVSQVIVDKPGTSLTAVYDYRPVTISPPEDSQALPSFDE